jgi:hypothetical protein
MRPFASPLLPSSGPFASPHSVFRLLAFRSLLFFATPLLRSSTPLFFRAFAPPTFSHPHFPNSAFALFPFVPQLPQSYDTPLIAPLLCSSCPLHRRLFDSSFCHISLLRSNVPAVFHSFSQLPSIAATRAASIISSFTPSLPVILRISNPPALSSIPSQLVTQWPRRLFQ